MLRVILSLQKQLIGLKTGKEGRGGEEGGGKEEEEEKKEHEIEIEIERERDRET